jgi:hypothetical protein
MKTSLTLCLAGVAMAATLSLVAASNYNRAPTASAPARVIQVREVKLVSASSYAGVAHIIHIPQYEERHARASAGLSVSERDEPTDTYNHDEPILPRHRSAPRWPSRSEMPPPPALQRRAVLSGPPPLADGPTPIRPLPRLGAKSSDADKFSSPDRTASAPPDLAPLPAGNTPAALTPVSDQPDSAK